MPVAVRRSLLTWADHVAKWRDCQLCPLGRQRDRIVLARGMLPCDVLFVGEAPGSSEDAIGQPFVGPAGKLLDQIVSKAVPPTMTCAFTNLVACFPRVAKTFSDNHQPSSSEIRACHSRLCELVNIARPRLIVAVGGLATMELYLHGNKAPPRVDIVHPAAILRMPVAQQQMAAQKSIVVLRNAIEDVLQSKCSNFTNWESNNAGSTSPDGDDIPF